jgi:phage/plasmid-like protein (TIGR03299 family)
MGHEVESMVSVREVPWHGLGTIVDEYMTAEECIKAAGLDWTVELRPVAFLDIAQSGGPAQNWTLIENRLAVVRDTEDQAAFEIVSDQYTPIQNADAFGFLDEMVNHGSGRAYDTAGSLKGGRQVFLSVKLSETGLTIPETGRDRAHDETVDLYLVVSTSHDRSLAFSAMVTPVRPVCQNTLNMGLRRNKGRWTTKHIADADKQAREAQRALGLVDEYVLEFSETMQALASIEVELAAFESMVTKCFPAPAGTRASFSQEQYGMIGLFESSPTLADVPRNGWRALNAVTEWDQWGKPLRLSKDLDIDERKRATAETQVNASWFGEGPKRAERVVKHLLSS